MAQERFFFHASSRPEAQAAAADLRRRLPSCAPADADVIVVLGGDGTMLDAMAEHHLPGRPFYGLNYGSVGFLLNPPLGADSLAGRIAAARAIAIHPLRMQAQTVDGKTIERMAFNDVSVRRYSAQSARMAIDVDGTPRLRELVGDGVLVCTPTGSTAYNYSAGGPILPYDSQLMALTPVCAFRPRRWAGALLPQRSRVDITNLEPDFRPLSVSADSFTVDRIQRVTVTQDMSAPLRLLFDPDHGLEDRLFNEQFGTNCQ